MTNTATLIKKLSESVCIGSITETLDIARDYLAGIGKTTLLTGGNLLLEIKGQSDRTLLFDAHADEVGFVVTEVKDDGFLKVSFVGGLDLRTLPSHSLTVHGKRQIPAVFTSIPPHLAKGEPEYDDIAKLSVDTGLGSRAKKLVSVGDFVTFRQTACELQNGRITGKALDNRAGVAALLLLADRLRDKTLPANVALLFSNQEEIGSRGAVISAFSVNADEAVCVDTSFASFPGIPQNECGKLGHGPMIGYSPVLSRKIFDHLCNLAEQNEIPSQREIMGGRTATNADVIALTKSGIPTALVSVPLRYMHSDCETADIGDIEKTSELLFEYAMNGGALGD